MKTTAFFLSTLLCLSAISVSAEDLDRSPASKQQILYLAQSQNCKETLRLYKIYKEQLGRHDFEVLQQIATIWIEQSARSPVPEKQILGIFGFGVAGLTAPPDILESAILGPDAQLQSAALGFLGKMQEDYSNNLLNKAMSSQFLYTRLEAAYLLALRKADSATGQIESLMYRLPPQMRYFFPEFFAIIGTSEAIHVLRHLMDDAFPPTKIEAILSAARHGRDDLVSPIRAAATHLDNAEQEACAAALGYLKDMRSIKKLKKLSTHSSVLVQLSALHSLFLLGDMDAPQKIAEEAKKENIFAISLLAEIPGYEETLVPLLKNPNMQIRFNAALSLLRKKDARSIPSLLEFLIKDSKDIGFQPQVSTGGSLRSWKVISSLKQHAEESYFDIQAVTLSLKEHLIMEAVELPESEFLRLAYTLLETKQNELVPAIVSMLENLRTPEAIALLKKYSQATGAPLIRTYCNLTLFKLKEEGPYQEAIRNFLVQSKSHELIRFRAAIPWNMRLNDSYHLTPEESSALLISAYETLANKQDSEGIDILLDAIEWGHEGNRPVLCGILIHTMH